LAKDPLVGNYKLNSLVDVVCGGAPVAEELLATLRKRFPHIKHVREGKDACMPFIWLLRV